MDGADDEACVKVVEECGLYLSVLFSSAFCWRLGEVIARSFIHGWWWVHLRAQHDIPWGVAMKTTFRVTWCPIDLSPHVT